MNCTTPCLCDTCLSARDSELKRVRKEERERAQKIIEDVPEMIFNREDMIKWKQEALKKLNEK